MGAWRRCFASAGIVHFHKEDQESSNAYQEDKLVKKLAEGGRIGYRGGVCAELAIYLPIGLVEVAWCGHGADVRVLALEQVTVGLHRAREPLSRK